MASSFFAWIQDLQKIKLVMNQEVVELQVVVFDHVGKEYPVSKIERDGHILFLSLDAELNFNRNILVSVNGNKVYAYYSRDVLNRYFYYKAQDLGAKLIENELELKFWSPTAVKVQFCLFAKDQIKVLGRKNLVRMEQGIWYAKLTAGDFSVEKLDGHYYQLEVTAYGKITRGLDPYAKSMAVFRPNDLKYSPKAAIIDFNKFGKMKPYRLSQANQVDFIAYEAHIRDFTIRKKEDALKGTYLGMKKLVPYFKELGITHLQFMPLQSFYSVNEDDRSFQDKNIPKEKINYNWGYDPHNYFTPSGWYSQDPFDPYARLYEVRELINSFHEAGVGVILDVVYNHVYKKHTFEDIAPGCYLRREDNGNISFKTGAGASLETRVKMAQKLIIDSLKYWKDFFGIDGFRFDLMGFLDHETMLQIRKALGRKAILYGEGWNFTDLPPQEATTKNNLPKEANLAVFNDSCRDACIGPNKSQGFLQGNHFEWRKLKAAIIASLKKFNAPDTEMSSDSYHRFARTPGETINYLTIHDGFTLWDKINLTVRGSKDTRLNFVKEALAMLFTSQGKIIVHGGVEFARSKPLAPNDPNPGRAHTSENVEALNGVGYFHENSYRSPDITNAIDWEEASNFKELSDYFKGLVCLRRSIPALRYRKSRSIINGLKFLKTHHQSFQLHALESKGIYSFTDQELTDLTIEFNNAPQAIRNKRMYLTGEIHPKESRSKNPGKNPYFIDFNNEGCGEITFGRSEIDSFDLKAWDDPLGLNIKLVEDPADWNYPEGAYTDWGNNSIYPQSILEGNRVIIDLSYVDHGPLEFACEPESYVAFILDNTLEDEVALGFSKLPYGKILVVYNASFNQLMLQVPDITTPKNWQVLVDNKRAGITPINESSVKVYRQLIMVPGNCCTVLAGL